MAKPNDTSVTYTGTAGAGMVAYVTDLGSYSFGIDFPNGWGEWKDVRRFQVAGPAEAYDAIIAMNVGGWGCNGANPNIDGIYGGPIKMVEKFAKDKKRQLPGFIVEVAFSRPPMGVFGDTNVLARPVVVNFGFTFLRIPAETDGEGYVIVNSAGDIFDPPQSIDIALLKIRCSKWLSSYSYSNAQSLVGKVNASSVTLATLGTVDARCLKCLNYAPANDIILAAPYVNTMFEFELRLDTYDRKLIDKGFRAWYSDTGGTARKGKLCGKNDLQPIPQPVLLDGTGQPLLPDHLAILDHPNGFSGFTAAPSGQLPAYLTAVRGTDSSGGFYLPYHVELEASFAPFSTIGI